MKKNTKLVALLFFILSTGTTASSQSLNLKIMSFNIQQPYGTNWDGRKSNVVSIINTTQADIIGTQEAVNYQREYLTQETGYAWYGSGRDGGDSGEGSWIFYKKNKYTLDASNSGNFWLSDTPNVPSRFGGAYNRICTYVHLIEKSSGKGFYVFNAHFPTPDLSNERFKSMKLLTERMANRAIQSDPVYATGDFNSNEVDAVTIWMKNDSDNPIRCRDTYRDFDPTGNVNTGFGTKFDYIYCPNDSKYTTQNSWVVMTPSASDHKPIVAEVKYEDQVNPPGTAPHAIPGKIEAENYAHVFGVISENTTDIGEGKNLGYLDANDWIEYNVSVAAASNYLLELRSSSSIQKGELDILVDGLYNQTIVLPVTNGWQTWETVTKDINLPAGLHTIRFQVITAGFNLNWFNFVPSNQSGLSIPGKIEAENYSYSFGTQLEDTSDIGGGKNVGYLDANDLLEYSVSVTNDGAYTLDIRVASYNESGRIAIIVDNQLKKSIEIPITGDWQAWETVSTNIDLSRGTHQLKLEVVRAGFNLNWFNFSNTIFLTAKVNSISEASVSGTFYPNPSNDYIYFDEEYDWTIYDISGKEIVSGRSQKADISALNAGIYIVYFNGMKKKLIVN
jgi:endonuclease/exonuclease/phosphatase family metal-dependent hydrolase